MKLRFIPYFLEFNHPFGISSGTRDRTPVVFTKIEHLDQAGYGEASLPPYLGESQESCIGFLKKVKPLLEGFSDPLAIEDILRAIDQAAPGNTAAKAAVDIALHDLAGK